MHPFEIAGPEEEQLALLGENAVGASPDDEFLVAHFRRWEANTPAKAITATAPLLALLAVASHMLAGLGTGYPVKGDRFRNGKSIFGEIEHTLTDATPNQVEWSGAASATYDDATNKQISLVNDFLRSTDNSMADGLDEYSDLIFSLRIALGLGMLIAVGAIELTCIAFAVGVPFCSDDVTVPYMLAFSVLTFVAAASSSPENATPVNYEGRWSAALEQYQSVTTQAQTILAAMDAALATHTMIDDEAGPTTGAEPVQSAPVAVMENS